MNISDVMTHGAESVRPEATLREAARKMKDIDVGPLPVCNDEGNVVGIITDRDITIRAVAEGKNPEQVQVQEVMSTNVVCCYEDQSTDEAVNLMEENQIRRLVVMDRDENLVGMVSLGDIAVKTGDERLSGRVLEEVSEPSVPQR